MSAIYQGMMETFNKTAAKEDLEWYASFIGFHTELKIPEYEVKIPKIAINFHRFISTTFKAYQNFFFVRNTILRQVLKHRKMQTKRIAQRKGKKVVFVQRYNVNNIDSFRIKNGHDGLIVVIGLHCAFVNHI